MSEHPYSSHIVRSGTPRLSSLPRALAALEAIIADGGERSLSALAREMGIPVATAHRQVATLLAERYLVRSAGGRLFAGPRLVALTRRADEKQIVVKVAAPFLHKLAIQARCVVQLGTLEDDMVTYRIKTGRGSKALFTKVGMQLEAYCTGIGKVLLAHQDPAERARYLAGGPFVALTERTIVAPEALEAEFARIRAQGYAVDDEEMVRGLRCVAAPVRKPDGQVLAAISLSAPAARFGAPDVLATVPSLRALAATVESAAFG